MLIFPVEITILDVAFRNERNQSPVVEVK